MGRYDNDYISYNKSLNIKNYYNDFIPIKNYGNIYTPTVFTESEKELIPSINFVYSPGMSFLIRMISFVLGRYTSFHSCSTPSL